MDLGLKGKKAAVAASSKGIGLAIVRALLNEGSFVLMNGRDNNALENSQASVRKSGQLENFYR